MCILPTINSFNLFNCDYCLYSLLFLVQIRYIIYKFSHGTGILLKIISRDLNFIFTGLFLNIREILIK